MSVIASVRNSGVSARRELTVCGERHYESKVSCAKMQQNDSGQSLNSDLPLSCGPINETLGHNACKQPGYSFLSWTISTLALTRKIGRKGGLMVSVLDVMQSRFEPWPGSLHCVLGQNTFVSQCLSPARCINGYQRNYLHFVMLR